MVDNRIIATMGKSVKRNDNGVIDVSPATLRAARAWLRWDFDQAAAASGVGRVTIFRIEHGEQAGRPATLRKLQEAYRREGMVFGPNSLSGPDTPQ